MICNIPFKKATLLQLFKIFNLFGINWNIRIMVINRNQIFLFNYKIRVSLFSQWNDISKHQIIRTPWSTLFLKLCLVWNEIGNIYLTKENCGVGSCTIKKVFHKIEIKFSIRRNTKKIKKKIVNNLFYFFQFKSLRDFKFASLVIRNILAVKKYWVPLLSS